MTLIRRASPWSQYGSLRHAARQIFDETAYRPIARSYRTPRSLPLDVTSGEDAITVEAALPGVRPEDVKLTVHEDALTISVKEAEEPEATEGERLYREVRRSHGSRTLRLPNGLDVDAAVATFENGLLRLSIPRAEAAKARQIPLSTVTEAPAQVIPDDQVGEAAATPETAEQA